MNVYLRESTLQLFLIVSVITLISVVTFFQWPAGVTGATARVPCVAPEDGMEIVEDTLLCTGTYSLDKGVVIRGDKIALDCNHAVLEGNGRGTGITVVGAMTSIKDCRVKGFQYGMFVSGQYPQLVNTHFLENQQDVVQQ